MFQDQIYKYLDTALDFGLSEFDFWNMTIAEVNRYFKSKMRVIEIQDRKQASFDYVLADLIGRSIARVYNQSNTMPTIAEAYPSLFNKEEIEDKAQQKKDELSALRFKQFAQAFNKKYKEVPKEE